MQPGKALRRIPTRELLDMQEQCAKDVNYSYAAIEAELSRRDYGGEVRINRLIAVLAVCVSLAALVASLLK